METFNTKMFENKVVVVTGGTSGIGYAVSVAFAEKGAKVWALGLQTDKVTYPAGLNIEAVEIDVTDKNAVDTFFSKLDRIDSLFNGAGMGSIAEHELDTFKRVMDVNLTSVFYISEVAAKHLAKSDNPSITNVSSLYAIFGSALAPAYSSSKGAIDQLTFSHALSFSQAKIRVNAVAPGWIDTPLIQPLKDMPEVYAGIMQRSPMQRLGKPEEIANVVVFLASEAASFINGSIVKIDGGYSIL
ncbi:SDR family NAD(P)-dependent oxidoreductase [Acinetobacter sp. MB5]|uniref:SDR family NAD(P)-dependent oxidoreductase n=1 Tax=Acinetobacter sp. MB5 TaxID=2069438 RepID=UPI000DD01894|nr:SDR family oxidoreductase [Acinetobacter sp. MB5]